MLKGPVLVFCVGGDVIEALTHSRVQWGNPDQTRSMPIRALVAAKRRRNRRAFRGLGRKVRISRRRLHPCMPPMIFRLSVDTLTGGYGRSRKRRPQIVDADVLDASAARTAFFGPT